VPRTEAYSRFNLKSPRASVASFASLGATRRLAASGRGPLAEAASFTQGAMPWKSCSYSWRT
jgi:hypothetical protein